MIISLHLIHHVCSRNSIPSEKYICSRNVIPLLSCIPSSHILLVQESFLKQKFCHIHLSNLLLRQNSDVLFMDTIPEFFLSRNTILGQFFVLLLFLDCIPMQKVLKSWNTAYYRNNISRKNSAA